LVLVQPPAFERDLARYCTRIIALLGVIWIHPMILQQSTASIGRLVSTTIVCVCIAVRTVISTIFWPLVFCRNLQCQPIRGVNTREECHWSHACLLQGLSRVYISAEHRAPYMSMVTQ
jgi:hypothetical protein